MLLQQLDHKDLQFESMSPFDGAMAYAQNKRQQVVMTDHWAKQHKEVHFSVMHPGKLSFYIYAIVLKFLNARKFQYHGVEV